MASDGCCNKSFPMSSFVRKVAAWVPPVKPPPPE